MPGLLANGDELAGKAAVVDAPVGSGHVVLFGIRPLWRWESQGSFALALNAIANWGALSSTSTVLFHHRVTAQRARELPLHVNAPTERNGVERSLFWPHRTHLRDCSPIGGTTDERRPSFQLYTVVIGGRRKRSSVRAGRAREKAGFSGGRQTRAAAPTRQASSRPSEQGGPPGTRSTRSPAPARSGVAPRSPNSTRSAGRSACSPAPACSATFADPNENTSACAHSGEKNTSARAHSGEKNTSACARSGENSGTADRPPC